MLILGLGIKTKFFGVALAMGLSGVGLDLEFVALALALNAQAFCENHRVIRHGA